MGEVVIFGCCQLHREKRTVLGPNGSARLSARSFEVLSVLLSKPNKVFSKKDIICAVWSDMTVEDINLQICIWELRKALPPGMILTVHSRGYTYVGPMPMLTECCSVDNVVASALPHRNVS